MPDRETLADRQKEVLEFIQQSIVARGYPPTLREIGEQMGIRSTNGVNDHLKALEKKGYLAREDLKSRALRPLRGRDGAGAPPAAPAAAPAFLADELVEIPIIGRVAAGLPLLAGGDVADTG